jgi:hypothetical protein
MTCLTQWLRVGGDVLSTLSQRHDVVAHHVPGREQGGLALSAGGLAGPQAEALSLEGWPCEGALDGCPAVGVP